MTPISRSLPPASVNLFSCKLKCQSMCTGKCYRKTCPRTQRAPRAKGWNIRCEAGSLPASPSAAKRILSSAAQSKQAQLLRSLAPFKELPSAAISALLLAGREELYKDGASVLVTGRLVTGLLVVLEGKCFGGG